jgi:hypothetical protein
MMPKSVWDRLEGASPINFAAANTSAVPRGNEPAQPAPPEIKRWRKLPVLRKWFPAPAHPVNRAGEQIGNMVVRGLLFKSADRTSTAYWVMECKRCGGFEGRPEAHVALGDVCRKCEPKPKAKLERALVVKVPVKPVAPPEATPIPPVITPAGPVGPARPKAEVERAPPIAPSDPPALKPNRPKPKAARFMIVERKLRAMFPEIFPQFIAKIRPLAVGIAAEILADPRSAGLKPIDVGMALRSWVRHPAYFKALMAPDARRIALDGSDAGPVDPSHAGWAKIQLDHFKAKIKAKGELRLKQNANNNDDSKI